MRIVAPKLVEGTLAGPGDDYQHVSATPEAFGSLAAIGTKELGGSIQQVTEKYQDAQNETAVNDAYSADFGPKFRDLYQKYYALQGKDAVDQMPAFQQQMQQLREDSRKNLRNPDQQRMFDQISHRRIEMELNGMVRYSDQQNKIWQHQTSDAVLNHSLNDAADKWNDEHAFGTALGGGYAEIDRFATRIGQSAETARLRADEFTSKAFTQRIQSAMVHDPLAAQAIYDSNKNQIMAAERPVLEHQLKSAVFPVEAKRDAMSIIGADAPNNGAPMTATQLRSHLGNWMAKAETVAEKKYPNDPIYRDMVVNQISTYTNRIAVAEEALGRNARNTVLTAAITPQQNGERVSDLNTLLADPRMKDAWSRMEPTEQHSILTVLEHNAKGVDPPETIESLNKWHQLRGLAANDPAAFQDELDKNFNEIGKVLPKRLFVELINESSSIDKSSAKEKSYAVNVSRIHSTTDGLLQQAGFELPKGKGESRQDVMDAYQNWTSRMLEEGDRFYAEHKKKPSDDDLRKMAQQLLVKGYESGSGHTWFGYTWGQKNVSAFQANDNFAVPAPPTEAKKISDAYNKTFGRLPTQSEIDQWYAARLRQKK